MPRSLGKNIFKLQQLFIYLFRNEIEEVESRMKRHAERYFKQMLSEYSGKTKRRFQRFNTMLRSVTFD